MSTEKRGGILVNWGSLKWKKYGYLHKIKLDFKMRVEKIQKKWGGVCFSGITTFMRRAC